ncbi:hypothetical protein BSKO_01539 [Bryopsis sp. KO-2023]|nr:hypothetical protein BSKO_01539 [Bryopsis sp. KO-2023]
MSRSDLKIRAGRMILKNQTDRSFIEERHLVVRSEQSHFGMKSVCSMLLFRRKGCRRENEPDEQKTNLLFFQKQSFGFHFSSSLLDHQVKNQTVLSANQIKCQLLLQVKAQPGFNSSGQLHACMIFKTAKISFLWCGNNKNSKLGFHSKNIALHFCQVLHSHKRESNQCCFF